MTAYELLIIGHRDLPVAGTAALAAQLKQARRGISRCSMTMRKSRGEVSQHQPDDKLSRLLHAFGTILPYIGRVVRTAFPNYSPLTRALPPAPTSFREEPTASA